MPLSFSLFPRDRTPVVLLSGHGLSLNTVTLWLNAWLTRTEVSVLYFCAYVHVWEEYRTRIITNFSDSLWEITDGKKVQAATISVLCLKRGFFLLFLLSAQVNNTKSHNRESNSETSAKNSHSNHNKHVICDELDLEKLTVAGNPQEQEDPRDHDWGWWRGWNLRENSGRVWNRSWQAQTCTRWDSAPLCCWRGRILRSLSAVSFYPWKDGSLSLGFSALSARHSSELPVVNARLVRWFRTLSVFLLLLSERTHTSSVARMASHRPSILNLLTCPLLSSLSLSCTLSLLLYHWHSEGLELHSQTPPSPSLSFALSLPSLWVSLFARFWVTGVLHCGKETQRVQCN